MFTQNKFLCAINVLLFFLAIGFLIACDNSATGPDLPKENMVTFIGRAFLTGQPPPVNPWHLPLHYDIEVITYLPGDATMRDTTYTDSSGVYTTTRLRKNGLYTLVSRYPYYSNDTVHVEVKNGQVVGEIPRLFSQRLLKVTIFPDSLGYNSLNSLMKLTQFATNLSPTDTMIAPSWMNQTLVPKDDPSIRLSTVDPNDTYGVEVLPLQTRVYYNARFLGQFTDYTGTISPKSGEYYLYARGQVWTWTVPYGYWHYKKEKWRWWFKVMEPTEIIIELE